jgi:hypothetical protein
MMTILVCATTLSGNAIAGSASVDPIYFGDRSPNPERETYAYPFTDQGKYVLVFVGPRRNIGAVTGDPEKDTIAYRPLVAKQDGAVWSFQLTQ